MLIASNDDPGLFYWILNAQQREGSFISSLATAAVFADCENYPLIRPLILQMRKKYAKYERPSA